MMKLLMLKRGLRLLTTTGNVNSSSPLTHRRCFSSLWTSSFSTSSSPLNAAGVSSDSASAAAAADFDEDDLFLGDELARLASKPKTDQNLLQPGVVVYDGVCHLSHNSVKWVIKADRDRKIKFCCLQSKAAEPYMRVSGVDRDDVLRRFLFIEGPGLYHQGSTAALRVLAHLPLPYSALSTLMIIPTPLRDAVYDRVAKKRYNWFGKSDDCLVLRDQYLLYRFIDREELLERSRSVL
ncbi:uncharacterized protein [Nicotiana tomentosiformis]|uniref:uncharacterized protein isoform X2 n=1 Tax=Nicotiana tomentosiformis TaxID=4098 RepID=UPI00051B0BDE|nr:uncharacterized protein LOC104115765 isoform X2 [Nicotiana tomentosiformis]XP_016470981.1 PREDICTED: uncharacterized protein LOC107793197 isoform X2 [Nicotiana tabacum]